MFCPKCGTHSIEKDQRFCKSCGTNLQAVNDAIDKSETKPELSKDPFGYGLNIVSNIVDSVKESVGDVSINKDPRRTSHVADKMARRQEKMEEWKAKHEAYLEKREQRRRYKEKTKHIPEGNVLLTYSSEHNLRHGLMNFFGGLGFAIFLFYFCRAALDAGAIQDIEELTHRHINALEPFIRWLWLLPGISVLKGLGQIFYAAFFAESIKTLSERFRRQAEAIEDDERNEERYVRNTARKDEVGILPALPVDDKDNYRRNTAPPSNTAPMQESLPEPPPSVTEGTTRFFEEAKAAEKG